MFFQMTKTHQNSSLKQVRLNPITFFRHIALLLGGLLLSPLVYGQPSMPWEDGLMQIQRALTGTTAHIIIVIAIALGGIAFAVGEHGSLVRKAAAVIFGGSIATGAASLYVALKLSGS